VQSQAVERAAMIFVLTIGVGLLIGLAINIVWGSIDALLGTSTLIENKALGVFGISVVLSNVVIFGMIAWDDIRHG
jgi:hypothetical protein